MAGRNISIPSYLAVVEEICRQLSIRLHTIVAVTPDLVEDRGQRVPLSELLGTIYK